MFRFPGSRFRSESACFASIYWAVITIASESKDPKPDTSKVNWRAPTTKIVAVGTSVPDIDAVLTTPPSMETKHVDSDPAEMSVSITLQFGGGAELLFDKIKRRDVELPPVRKYFPNSDGESWTIRSLLVWLKENLLREREELFLQGETVRAGILVLVNDADWELLGELDYVLRDGDTVMFISTLHGG